MQIGNRKCVGKLTFYTQVLSNHQRLVVMKKVSKKNNFYFAASSQEAVWSKVRL